MVGSHEEKGQSIIEFAIVFPLFLALFMGIAYFGMLFFDFMTVADVARSSAREASLLRTTATQTQYDTIRDKQAAAATMWTSIYTWDKTSDAGFSIKSTTVNSTNDSVQVTIYITRNVKNLNLPGISIILPLDKTFTYTMIKEPASSS